MSVNSLQIHYIAVENTKQLSDSIRSKIVLLDQQLDDQHWNLKLWNETWDDFGHFVLQYLEQEGQILGFALWTMPPQEQVAHLLKLVIDVPYRLKGHARYLMDDFSQKYLGKGIYLEVKTSNTTAVKFYQKMGLKILTKTKNYYPKGADAYKMMKTLPSS